jgi:hypothetical protein
MSFSFKMVERHTIAIGDGKWIDYCLVAVE